jgi:membrane protease YdiL (CAAX protease family)
MKKIMEFIGRERLYLFLLTFIILINVIVITDSGSEKHKKVNKAAQGHVQAAGRPAVPEKPQKEETRFLKGEDMAKALANDKTLVVLFGLTSLFMIVVFLLGVVIDILFAIRKFSGNSINITTLKPGPAKWGIWDVGRVVVLFLFFGYMIVMVESFLIKYMPIMENDNVRMMVNTSILDIMAVVFILHFTVGQYKDQLTTLGISAKNIGKNIFYGIVGYIAAAPMLVLVLAVIAIIVNLTKYIPEKQPVVELFLKESNQQFLILTSIFTAVVGPLIEELFFRGFMYNAFKKRIGIFWAMFITSAVFASLHTNIVGFAPILVLGMLLAYMYEMTGTLVAPITIHVIHNLSMVFLVFLMKNVKA